jgi:hypothetical protein
MQNNIEREKVVHYSSFLYYEKYRQVGTALLRLKSITLQGNEKRQNDGDKK